MRFRISGIIVAAALAVGGFSATANASTVTYDIVLTQTAGTLLLTQTDFTASASFSLPANFSGTETIDGVGFTIGTQIFTSNLTVQATNGVINNVFAFSGTANGDTLVVGVNSFNLFGAHIPSTDVGSVSITPAATPLPAALPLFATGLGALGLLGWRRKRTARSLAV
jgi:hypothetical protein